MAHAKPLTGTGKAQKRKRQSLVTPRPDDEVVLTAADRRTVSGRVRICREATGLKKAEVARKLKISAATVGDWENGDTRAPKAENLLNLRDELGYNIDFIVRGTGMPLLPNFEEMAKENTLISIFRDLGPHSRDSLVNMAQTLRRAEGHPRSDKDPFGKNPPKPQNGDDD